LLKKDDVQLYTTGHKTILTCQCLCIKYRAITVPNSIQVQMNKYLLYNNQTYFSLQTIQLKITPKYNWYTCTTFTVQALFTVVPTIFNFIF